MFKIKKEQEKLLEEESLGSFRFFWEEANADPNSTGYGLIRDRAPGSPRMASIASVGFGLSAIVIGAERGWVSYEEAKKRAVGTLHTLLHRLPHHHGFFYHFMDMETGARYGKSEVSIIDTAIALCGALTAGEYFGEEAKELATRIYERVDWNWYRNRDTNQFYMGYAEEEGRHFGAWDHYAEQFMMYFLGAASPTHPVDPEMFYQFERFVGEYGSYGPIIHSWTGSLFVYQFSHAWFDLRGLVDRDGVDWFRNSVLASLANRQFCIDLSSRYQTFGLNSWGLTACDGPKGYSGGYGAKPNKVERDFPDSTIPPCGPIGSIVFTPEESIAAMEHFRTFPGLWGKYGFQDAYNLDVDPAWYARDVIGIDKGISLLMIENFRTGLIWEVFMRNRFAREGLSRVGFRPKAGWEGKGGEER
ncbi:conserved hypothetical protein [[Clostridium] ultunense Esp]|nr:conserved hypothetical protein [[Clostridium] ultunense Esp]